MGARVFVVLCAIVLAFSGCAGADGAGKASSSSPPPTAAEPTVTADTGSITGRVSTEELTPIVGAEVGIVGADGAPTLTDENGQFTFNDLTPGSVSLVAQKLGFESASKKVDVVAGGTTHANFTLEAIIVDSEPRMEFQQHEGFIEGPSLYTIAVTYRATNTFDLNVTPGAKEIVLSMAWLANAPTTARYMYEQVALDDVRNATFGKSPLTTRITDLDVEKKEKAKVTWYLHFACLLPLNAPQDWVLCVSENPEAAIPVVAYQQKVSFYSTVFYNQASPEGYTGLPP